MVASRSFIAAQAELFVDAARATGQGATTALAARARITRKLLQLFGSFELFVVG